MKNILVLGVGGIGRPSIGLLGRFPDTGVVIVDDNKFNSLMHMNERKDTVPVSEPVTLTDMEMTPTLVNYIDKNNVAKIEREYILKDIIKKSKNHLEILNAQRELNEYKFNQSKRKNTKK